jgi:hypothetical protein
MCLPFHHAQMFNILFFKLLILFYKQNSFLTKKKHMLSAMGFEPMTNGLKDRCSGP